MEADDDPPPRVRVARHGPACVAVEVELPEGLMRHVGGLALDVRSTVGEDSGASTVLRLALEGRFEQEVEFAELVDVERSAAKLRRKRRVVEVRLPVIAAEPRAADAGRARPSCGGLPRSPDGEVEAYEHEWPEVEVWPMSGFCPEFFMWRLTLLAEPAPGGAGAWRVTVATQLEQLSASERHWPAGGLVARVALQSAHLTVGGAPPPAVLAFEDVRLTWAEPVAVVELPAHAAGAVIVAEQLGGGWPRVVGYFHMLGPPGLCGALLPVAEVLDALGCKQSLPARQDLCAVPHPPPEWRSEPWPQSGHFDWTGGLMWDAGVILGYILVQVVRAGAGARLLELGCGLGNTGVYCALAGLDVVATDVEGELGVCRATFEANSAGVAAAGGSWCARALDWGDPPPWALEERWSVVFGADLLYDSGVPGLSWPQDVHDDGPRHEIFVRLLSRLRFDVLILADRERSLHVTRAFFDRLHEFGMEAHRLDTPGGGRCRRGPHAGAPLTKAVDIGVWRLRRKP